MFSANLCCVVPVLSWTCGKLNHTLLTTKRNSTYQSVLMATVTIAIWFELNKCASRWELFISALTKCHPKKSRWMIRKLHFLQGKSWRYGKSNHKPSQKWLFCMNLIHLFFCYLFIKLRSYETRNKIFFNTKILKFWLNVYR